MLVSSDRGCGVGPCFRNLPLFCTGASALFTSLATQFESKPPFEVLGHGDHDNRCKLGPCNNVSQFAGIWIFLLPTSCRHNSFCVLIQRPFSGHHAKFLLLSHSIVFFVHRPLLHLPKHAPANSFGQCFSHSLSSLQPRSRSINHHTNSDTVTPIMILSMNRIIGFDADVMPPNGLTDDDDDPGEEIVVIFIGTVNEEDGCLWIALASSAPVINEDDGDPAIYL